MIDPMELERDEEEEAPEWWAWVQMNVVPTRSGKNTRKMYRVISDGDVVYGLNGMGFSRFYRAQDFANGWNAACQRYLKDS